MTVRFAAWGVGHIHSFDHVEELVAAGAQFAGYAPETTAPAIVRHQPDPGALQASKRRLSGAAPRTAPGAQPPVSACGHMDRDQHQKWLAELAADDLRRRREAQPELAKKEAALRKAHADLSRSEAAVQALEAELDAHSRQADDVEDG